jgi:exonuclease SbcC
MRPHRLRVTAFGAFAATETVTFDDLDGLFLLHGETGAGKTTLLDAIAFALYGRVPGERGQAKRLRSDHAAQHTATEVELEATIGGRRMRITRRPEQDRAKKSGAGVTKEQASVRLDERSEAGRWENKSTRVVEADDEIKSLMGMSAEQFFQVVLLPQGKFAEFLHASAQKKEELLEQLFGTDRFRKVEDWLVDRNRAAKKEVEAAASSVTRLVAQLAQAAGVPVPDSAPATHSAATGGAATVGADSASSGPWQAAWAAALAADAAAVSDAAAVLVETRKADLNATLAAKSEAEHLANRQRRRVEALGRQQELQAVTPAHNELRAEAEAASRAAEVAPVFDAADRAASAAATARQAEAQARDAIPVSPDLPASATAARLRAAAEEQRAQLGRLDELGGVVRQVADEETKATAARDNATELAAEIQRVETEARRLADGRSAAAQARDAASRAAGVLPAVQARSDDARRVAADSAALATERATRDRLHAEHLDAREQAVTMREEASRLREARIDGMRAELAAAMTDGTPCPVCGSLDHPDPVEPTFEPVSREQEAAAHEIADRTAAESDAAGQRLAAADAVIASLLRRLAESGFAAPAAQADLMTKAAAAEAEADRLSVSLTHLQATAQSVSDLQATLDELDEELAGSRLRLVELAEQRTAALAEADAAAARAADRRAELAAKLGPAPDLETATAAAQYLADTLAAAADATDQATSTAAEAAAAADRATAAATAAGFATIEAARAAFRDPDWRRDAADRISRHEAETETVATLLADPELADVAVDPPAPVAETTQAVTAAQQAHDAATTAHATARHTTSQLADLLPRLDLALAELKPKQDRADQAKQLADLTAGVGTANQYRMTLSSFVLAARLEEVAQAASERLLTMTAGRYSLVHSDARQGNKKAGLSLLAQDSWTGQDRDTATLSGGETFLASLALALGLADVVTAESAGSPMEALFVDEGFGTLDDDALDEVMTVLDTLRAGGRIVGIVSHVTELRQRIPAQIHVRKSRHGSHVTVIPG